MSYYFGGDSPPASSSASSSSSSSASSGSSSSASSSSASSSAGGSSSAASSSSSSSSSSSPAVTAVSPSSASSSSASSSSSSSPGISSGAIAITTSFVVVGGVVLIVVAVLIIKYVQKRMLEITSGGVDTVPLNSIVCEDPKNSKNEGGSMESFLDEFFKDKPIRFTPQDLEGFTSDYSEVLGSGGFGVVYKGQLSNGAPVAVKILRETLGKIAEGQFTREVSILSRTNHVNLVRLYGFCFDANMKALVYEYMDCGSLDQYLLGDDTLHTLQWEKLYEIAVGIAKGIRYLNEECDNKIIHFDIKPANILLSKNFFPKVADFGLAELCERETTLVTITGGKGTPGFVAPELWIPLPEIDKCDVYSFGMLLFEILWSQWSMELAQAESKEKFPRWVWEKVEHKELERVIMDCGDGDSRMKTERMCKVALWCVQHQPEKRPSMSKVVKMLEGEEKIDAPVNPFNIMVPSVK